MKNVIFLKVIKSVFCFVLLKILLSFFFQTFKKNEKEALKMLKVLFCFFSSLTLLEKTNFVQLKQN